MENTEQSPTTETVQPEQITAESVKGKTAAELESMFKEGIAQEEGNSESNDTESSTEEQPVTEAPKAEPQAEKPVQPQHDYEKAYRDLQADYTRKAQELAELKREHAPKLDQAKVESKLAQIRKENPDAATIFDEVIAQAKEEMRKEFKPIEERVVLRTKRENVESFSKAADEFKKSEYAELQPELDKILDEVSGNNSEHLYSNIEDNPGFFEYAMSVLTYRHRDKIKEIILRNASKTSRPDINAEIKGNPALRKSGASTVAGKSVASKEDALKNFTKQELEDMLPKSD